MYDVNLHLLSNFHNNYILPFSVNYTIDIKWMDKYEALKLFHTKHGHCEIIKTLKLDATKGIGRWINRQKEYANNNNFCKKRRILLDEIGFFDEENQRSQPGAQSSSVLTRKSLNLINETPSCSKSLIQRVNHLNDIVGMALETDLNLYEKVEMLEAKIFGKTIQETIVIRIELLEFELM